MLAATGRWKITLGVVVSFFAVALGSSLIAEDEVEGIAFFEKRIRPVLVENCYECHSVESGKRKGGLHLDNRASLRAGGDTGAVIDVDKPEASLLLTAISYHDADLQMPPEKRLPKAVVADFQKWLALGAPDPRDGAVSVASIGGIDFDEGRKFWSFRPLGEVEVPKLAGDAGSLSPVDAFLEARRVEIGLKSAAAADRRTLIRRLYFDLIGLPPAEADVQAFVDDRASDDEATADLVDRLLASKNFGERWGRHWLDVVRFAESSGGGRAELMHEAWRFRDYVIDSFNADRPFDRMVREHLAGDLMEAEASSAAQRRGQLIASGFLALGPTNYELQDKELLRMEVVDEQIDTMGRAFLGMTIGCARCHDHMFDPISAKDYYALAGIFRSTDTLMFGNVSSWRHAPLPRPDDAPPVTDEEQAAWQAFEKKVAELEVKFAATTNLGSRKGIGGEIIGLTVKKELPVYDAAMSVIEAEDAGDYKLAIRGDVHRLGEDVARAFPEVMQPADAVAPLALEEGASGRLELANWIASPEHPLTARVYVNRVWHHLFGQGLVRTVDNFGATGEKPSHPDLLDWLAAEFVADGWSTKAMVRRLVLTDAYRASSRADATQQRLDPENRLLARQNHRRLDAEVLRDSLLVLSGELDPTPGGKTLPRELRSEFGFNYDDLLVRSVYLPVFRNNIESLFSVFDFSNPNLVAGRRSVSTVPSQALYLMNSQFVSERAAHAVEVVMAKDAALPDTVAADELSADLADRLLDDELIERLFVHTLGREPSADEARQAYEFLQTFPEPQHHLALTALQQALFASVDFRYVD